MNPGRTTKTLSALTTAVALFFVLAAPSNGSTLTMPATDNIFGAGHATPPASPNCVPAANQGTLPTSTSFTAGTGRVLTIGATGGVSQGAPHPLTGPDGRTDGPGMQHLQNSGGISASDSNDHWFFLEGVFLTSSEPGGAGPARLNFSDVGGLTRGFTTVSPQIAQSFFIGDGLTGTGAGAVQRFEVPPTATRLFFGLEDANSPFDPPGCYDNNLGSFSIDFNVTGSNNFTIEPRITCAGVCRVILVQITFDSAGNVVAEQALPGQLAAESKKKKAKPLVKALTQAVTAGPNTLRLKLTSAAQKKLGEKGKLHLNLHISFTPTGGTAKSVVQGITIKLKKKH